MQHAGMETFQGLQGLCPAYRCHAALLLCCPRRVIVRLSRGGGLYRVVLGGPRLRGSFSALLATFLTCVDAAKNPSSVTLPWMFFVFSCEFWWCGACPVLCFS